MTTVMIESNTGEDKMKGSWRYVSTPEWLFDKKQELDSDNEEDKMIARLDGEVEQEDLFNAYDVLKSLTPKEAKIVELVLYDGLTFREVGEQMGCCKQNVHWLYNRALAKLKKNMPESAT